MFPSPALSLTMAQPIPGTALAGEPGGEANGADFLTLLTQTVDQAATTGEAAVDPAAVAATPLPDPAMAALAATTGTILPPALPVTALQIATLPERDAPPAGEPQAATPPLLPAKAAARAALRIVQHVPPARSQLKQGEGVETTEPEVAEAEILEASEAPVAVVVAPLALQPTLSALPAPAAEAIAAHRPEQPGMSEEAPGLLVRAQVPVLGNRPAQERGQPRVAPAQPAKPDSPELPQATAPAPQLSAPPIMQVRVEVPVSELVRAVVSGPARTPAPIAALLSEEPDSELSAILPVNAPQAAPQTLATTPATPLTRPHDFAALIDRLSAAREAASPQAVSVSLPHADFGRVQLHFRQDEAGLAVALSSSDPDFARIAAQAAPPILPVSETRSSETAGQHGTSRSDGQGAQASQNGQPRGQSQDRRGETQRGFEHQPRGRASPGKGEGRSGIFA